MQSPVLVLGATSTIARAIANQLAAENHNLILAGRNLDELKKNAADLRIRFGVTVQCKYFDAEALNGHQRFCDECIEICDDLLAGVVLCHGWMADQADAQNDFEQSRRMIEVNFTSAVSVLNRFANYFEKMEQGFICAFSSVAGDRGRQSNYLYGSTKAALNTYLEGLRNRLAKVKVPVLTVKPGFVDTRMTWGLPGMFLVAQPGRVGIDTLFAIQKRKNEIYTPWFWWGIMSIICHIPRFVFKRMKI